MTSLEIIRNRLINKILATGNEQFLEAIEKLFAYNQDEVISLSSEQIELLMMSEEDIKNGNLISEADLDKQDEKWQG